MKKKILIAVSVVVALALVLTIGIVIGKNAGATKGSSNSPTAQAATPSTQETDSSNPFKGNVVVMVSMYEGYLLTEDNAADLYHNIDPSLHKQNQKYVDMYADGERYYESNLDSTFIYEHYDDDFGLELGAPGCKIYDFRNRDFSSEVNLSTLGMQATETIQCQFGEFDFYQ